MPPERLPDHAADGAADQGADHAPDLATRLTDDHHQSLGGQRVRTVDGQRYQ